MGQVTRTSVTFVVRPGITDLPAGEHAGYVEYLTVYLHGHPHTSTGRCMLHLERNEHPECFSETNSMISMDINVAPQVGRGEITYR
jgi:hypothetical protein